MGLDQNLTLQRQDDTLAEFDWRKANAVHRWFVENVQGGEDDCGTYDVPVTKLRELRDILERVVDCRELGPELLPTQSGFFFGSTEYDDWYVHKAYMVLQAVIVVLYDFRDGDRITYGSCW